ncbi:MAG: hypothetical protein ACE14W_12575 [Candidatus Velamenicoccus archaeovorus]
MASTASEVLRIERSRILRAWLAVAAVLAVAALSLVLWMTFSGSEQAGTSTGGKARVGQTYSDGRFGEPIQIGDHVCHQCR